MTTPHDAAFRAVMARPERARDFLAFHLPIELRRVCDLSTLQLAPGSFIEDDLRAHCSDVLYSLKTDAGDGYVYCLIEHQSSPDRHMAFRLMRYAIAAMQQHIAAGHDALPLVIPLLFYHGQQSPYPWSLNWLDGFADPALAGRLYSHDFPLTDITVIPDHEIMTHRRVALLELLHKHIRLRDMAELSEPITTLLLTGYIDDDQLRILMHYMLQVGETRDPDGLLRGLAARAPEQGETIMTIAQQLEQRGRQEGRREGRQEGQLETVRNLIRETTLSDEMIAGVVGLDIEQVRALRNRPLD